MGFRTSSSAPPARVKPLPIQGMLRRNKSGDGLIAVLPTVTSQPRRLSRSTLHRIFAVMLAAVFICYCCLMLMMIQHRDKSIFDLKGKWGPTMATSQKVLRDHIHTLAEQKRKEFDEQLIRQQQQQSEEHADNSKAKNVTVDALGKSGSVHVSLEEVDIHDMKPPEAIERIKAQEQKKVSEAEKSKLDAVLETAAE